MVIIIEEKLAPGMSLTHTAKGSLEIEENKFGDISTPDMPHPFQLQVIPIKEAPQELLDRCTGLALEIILKELLKDSPVPVGVGRFLDADEDPDGAEPDDQEKPYFVVMSDGTKVGFTRRKEVDTFLFLYGGTINWDNYSIHTVKPTTVH